LRDDAGAVGAGCGVCGVDGNNRYWPTTKTIAIRTAARTARFSILMSLGASPAEDPSLRGEGDGIEPTATPQVPAHE
jgi:hypothetical protein